MATSAEVVGLSDIGLQRNYCVLCTAFPFSMLDVKIPKTMYKTEEVYCMKDRGKDALRGLFRRYDVQYSMT